MVNSIYNEVERLVRKYKTRNPIEIAESIGITVLFRDFKELKGFYAVENKSRYIVINNNLDDYLQNVICAHELGHDRLHRHFASYSAMQDYMLYDMKARPERDANIFASDLLISDTEVLLYARMYGYTHDQISSMMCVPKELMWFKTFSIMKRGYDIRTPDQIKSNFLSEI